MKEDHTAAGPSDEAAAALQKALSTATAEFKDIPDGEEIIEKVVARFQKSFETPPRQDFEFILQKTFTDDEVRVALFQPQEEQIAHYVKLLNTTCRLPIAHPLSKLHSLLISLIFLVHRRSWLHFMRDFVAGGGLQPLSELITDENLYLRGQVLEIFLSATDCDTYDWFMNPSQHSGIDTELHRNLYELCRSPHYFSQLFANRTGSYPGGSFRALQLIAFSLSWLRALHTADQKLSLSNTATTVLGVWATTAAATTAATTTAGNNANTAAAASSAEKAAVATETDTDTRSEIEGQTDDPEAQLAKTLFEDFTGRKLEDEFGASRITQQQLGGGAADAITAIGKGISAVLDETKLLQQDHKQQQVLLPPPPPPSSTEQQQEQEGGIKEPNQATQSAINPKVLSVDDLKNQGNELFKLEKYLAALRVYRDAVALIMQQKEQSSSTATMMSTLHMNSATVCWKLYEMLQTAGNVPTMQHTTEIHNSHGSSTTSSSSSSATDALLLMLDELGVGDGVNRDLKQGLIALSEATSQSLAAQLLHCCALESQSALQFCATNTKATYRLASIYLEQGQCTVALDTVNEALKRINDNNNSSSNSNSRCSSSSDSGSSISSSSSDGDNDGDGAIGITNSSNDVRLLQQIRRRSMATLLLHQSLPADDDAVAVDTAQLTTNDKAILPPPAQQQHQQQPNIGLDSKTTEVLAALLKQFVSEIDFSTALNTAASSQQNTNKKVDKVDKVNRSSQKKSTDKSNGKNEEGAVSAKAVSGVDQKSTTSKRSSKTKTTTTTTTSKSKSKPVVRDVAAAVAKADAASLDAMLSKCQLKSSNTTAATTTANAAAAVLKR